MEENELQKIAKLYPENFRFNMGSLSSNPNIDFNFIVGNLSNFSWSPRAIVTNSNITQHEISDICRYFSYCPEPNEISRNMGLTVDDILNSPTCINDWNYKFLSYNSNITSEFIFNHRHHFQNKAGYLSFNKNLSVSVLKYFSDWNWNYNAISIRCDFETILYLEEIGKLDFLGVSLNPNINSQFINKNIKKLQVLRLMQNPSVDFYIAKAINKNSSHRFIFNYNPNVEMKTILQNPDFDWHYPALSQNTGITMKDIQTYKKDWSIQSAFLNKNLTAEFVTENIKQVEWNYVARNELKKSTTYIKNKIVIRKNKIKRRADFWYKTAANSEHGKLPPELVRDIFSYLS